MDTNVVLEIFNFKIFRYGFCRCCTSIKCTIVNTKLCSSNTQKISDKNIKWIPLVLLEGYMHIMLHSFKLPHTFIFVPSTVNFVLKNKNATITNLLIPSFIHSIEIQLTSCFLTYWTFLFRIYSCIHLSHVSQKKKSDYLQSEVWIASCLFSYFTNNYHFIH